ncbi:hypothetical protein [Amycolatopsis keratiniphila]|nr:hypothetical protein [Amycolatopsis keratiniphila]
MRNAGGLVAAMAPSAPVFAGLLAIVAGTTIMLLPPTSTPSSHCPAPRA